MELKDADFPGLFKLSDKLSLKAQKTYISWFRMELVILVLAALIGSLSIGNEAYGKYVAYASALFFIAGLFISMYLQNRKFEEIWYMGRAIAESVKSISWRYMTRGEPYGKSISEEKVAQVFRNKLVEIFNENRKFLSDTLGNPISNSISDNMNQIRSRNFEERLIFYVDNRVKDQLDWYNKKSIYNRKQTRFYFNIVILFYAVAIIYHIYVIIDNHFYNAAPVIAAIVGCIISWSKMKQFRELANSYAVAAHEISLILEKSKEINTSEELEKFVGDTESAFSREHTLWLARRDVI